MNIFNVKAQIIVTEGCMTEFYDNDPQKVCDEIRRVMYKMYDTKNVGMAINRLKVELDEV